MIDKHHTKRFEEFDKILGTPSVQSILRVFIGWKRLAFKDIVTRVNFQKSQVSKAIKQLEQVQIIKRENRGNYILMDTPFVKTLAKAYTELIVQQLGMELHQINQDLDTLPPKVLSMKIHQLIFEWQPLLEEYYPYQLSSLVSHIVDRYQQSP